MKITDLSGQIKKGIWKYGDMYPDYSPRQIHAGENCFFCEVFEGFNSQTGTYLETTAHMNGYAGNRLIEDVSLEELVDIPCSVIRLRIDLSPCSGGRPRITASDFEKAAAGRTFNRGEALLFCCGWSDWYSPDFLSGCPYLSLDAMEWLLAREPSILGSDLPSWEKDEGVFETYKKTDTLMLAPLVNLEKIESTRGRLTVLPLNILHTCCTPVRAIFVEE